MSLPTASEISRIETAITNAKDAASRATGAIEGIDAELLSTYGLASVEAAEEEVAKLTEQLQAVDRRAETEADALRDACAKAGIAL